MKLIKQNLSQKIADYLRRQILEGEIPDGEHIIESNTAKEFGVSSGPVRDAIKILENEGFVYTPPNGRTIAKGFSKKDIEDYHSLRYYLESEAIKNIIMYSTNGDDYFLWLKELEGLILNMEKYLKLNFDEIVNNYDYKFHDSIINRSNNKFIIKIWQSLKGTRKSIMEINEKYLSDYDILSPKKFYHFHEGIYEGIKNNDLNKALYNIKEHLDAGTKIYKLVLDKINVLKTT